MCVIIHPVFYEKGVRPLALNQRNLPQASGGEQEMKIKTAFHLRDQTVLNTEELRLSVVSLFSFQDRDFHFWK